MEKRSAGPGPRLGKELTGRTASSMNKVGTNVLVSPKKATGRISVPPNQRITTHLLDRRGEARSFRGNSNQSSDCMRPPKDGFAGLVAMETVKHLE